MPNLVKEKLTEVQEALRVPNNINLKRSTSRHIIIKKAKVKDKEKILKAVRRETVTYKGVSIWLSSDYSTETLQAKRDWHEVFKMIKKQSLVLGTILPGFRSCNLANR